MKITTHHYQNFSLSELYLISLSVHAYKSHLKGSIRRKLCDRVIKKVMYSVEEKQEAREK